MGQSAYLRLFILFKLMCTCAGILGYNSRFSVYYGTPGKKLQPVHVLNNTVVRSKAECGLECEMSTKCKSVSYQSTTNTCLLSDLVLTELRYTADDDADWTSHSRNDWLLIFRAPAGIGGDVYQSYLNGTGVTTHDIDCVHLTSTECTSNYRHPIVDDWDTASFTKVRYSFYKDQAEVAYVEFNATGSDILSWFRKERVIESTWQDITTDTFIFSYWKAWVQVDVFTSASISVGVRLTDCTLWQYYGLNIPARSIPSRHKHSSSMPTPLLLDTQRPIQVLTMQIS